jgi:hypothetical protein
MVPEMHEKLVVGRYLEVPQFDNSAGIDTPGGPAHFVTTPNRNYQIEVSEGSGFLNRTRTSNVSPGQNANKAHRNFRWLHWQGGKITYLPLNGPDILTGPMSGCWVVIFTMAGQHYVGHIGTTAPGSTNTLQVKAAWAAAVQAGTVTPVAAFNPTRHLAVANTGFDVHYAVITQGQRLYAMRLHRQGANDTLNQISEMHLINGAGQAPGDPGHANFI